MWGCAGGLAGVVGGLGGVVCGCVTVTLLLCVFFFNGAGPTEIYPLSLHDALWVCVCVCDDAACIRRHRVCVCVCVCGGTV